MLTPNVFHNLRTNGVLRRYRRTLRERIQQEPALRLLPALAELPLRLADMAAMTPATLLLHTPFLTLSGMPGSGRSLALLQLALRHLTQGHNEPVLLLSLVQADIPALPPQVVLDQALTTIGMPTPPNRAHARTSRPPCLLLLDEWESLSPSRRAEWRTLLLSLPQTWPAARVVVTFPDESAEWPGYQAAALAPPDNALIQLWLTHLLPRHDHTSIYAAMKADAPLAFVRERLLDLALLCLTYPGHSLPANRPQLYAHALAALNRQHTSDPTPTAAHKPVFAGWSALRWYELACDMAEHHDLLPLAEMEEIGRSEVALLLAGMLPDAEPLYATLWGTDQPTPANLLILGRCLRERGFDAPIWWLRLLRALLDGQESTPHQELLVELGARLPALIVATGATLPTTPTDKLLAELAPRLGGPPLLALLDNQTLPADLRWAAADAFLQLPPNARSMSGDAAQPPDPLARAARCYLLALGTPEERGRLAAAETASWITALRDTPISEARRGRIAQAVLRDQRIPARIQSIVLAIAPQADAQTLLAVMTQACTDTTAAVRQDALLTLHQRGTEEALTVLGKILLEQTGQWAAQNDALEQLARYPQPTASTLLARCVLAPNLPLASRLRALRLIADRPGVGSLLLRRLLPAEGAYPAVRAMAAQLLGSLGEAAALPELCRVATGTAPSLVREGALIALGRLGQQFDHHQPEIVEVFKAVLQHAPSDLILTLAVIQATQCMGAMASVPLLEPFLASDLADRLRADWLTRAPHLDGVPFDAWSELKLPADMRQTLCTALAEGETEADRPGNLDELFILEANRIRRTVTTALAQIGRLAAPEERLALRGMLLTALHATPPNQEACHLLRCLAELSEDAGLSELDYLLNDPTLDPMLRWLAIEQLGAHPATVPLLVESLEREELDPFIASRVIQVLGQHSSPLALPVLCHLAEQTQGSLHMRTQAIAALGPLLDPAAEATLFRLIANDTIPVILRVTATDALPATFDPSRRVRLRALLHRERIHPELLAGVIGVMGRIRDQESLAAMLRYIHDDDPTVALRALTALAAVGDANVVPIVVRVAQGSANLNVRLHAVGTLLKLGGPEYLPLLRNFLESSVLSLQLQALDYLLSQQPDAPELMTLLTSETTPMAVRMRVVEAIAQQSAVLRALLLDENANPHLRFHTARILGQNATFDAIDALTCCARQVTSPLWVRYRCIDLLAENAVASHPFMAEARIALSQLAADPTQPIENRTWATSALVRIEY